LEYNKKNEKTAIKIKKTNGNIKKAEAMAVMQQIEKNSRSILRKRELKL
jgi:hypothetical protein